MIGCCLLQLRPDSAGCGLSYFVLCSQGCVFTRDINRAIRISDAMETGTVQVTCAVQSSDFNKESHGNDCDATESSASRVEKYLSDAAASTGCSSSHLAKMTKWWPRFGFCHEKAEIRLILRSVVSLRQKGGSSVM